MCREKLSTISLSAHFLDFRRIGSLTGWFTTVIRYTDAKLESHDDFPGFYNSLGSAADTLLMVIQDKLLGLGIPAERIKGW